MASQNPLPKLQNRGLPRSPKLPLRSELTVQPKLPVQGRLVLGPHKEPEIQVGKTELVTLNQITRNLILLKYVICL